MNRDRVFWTFRQSKHIVSLFKSRLILDFWDFFFMLLMAIPFLNYLVRFGCEKYRVKILRKICVLLGLRSFYISRSV